MNAPPPALTVDNISKNYGTLRALDSVSITVPHNCFFGLLGPNGAGKTTLIGILGGLVRPDSGTVTLLGDDLRHSPLAIRANIGIVPQELTYDPFLTVAESLSFQSKYYGIYNNNEWIKTLLEKLHLSEQTHINTRKLSGGMKRRLMIAQALVHKPPVIVLDEPTAGVDINLRLSLWGFIREFKTQGHTIILTTHYLEEAETLCDEVALLNEGKVIRQGNTRELINEMHTVIRVRIRLKDGNTLPPHFAAEPCEDGCHFIFKLQHYADIEPLLAKLRAADIIPAEVAVQPPRLEDAFVSMVGLA